MITIAKLQLKPSTLFLTIIFFVSTLMAFNTLPSFVSRFLRPFTSSTSLSYQPESLAAKTFPENTQKATVACGCFWGVEDHYRKSFGNGKGLLDARVGYTGGKTAAPTYLGVCSGTTGHAESLLIMYDPDMVSYRQLIEYFFRLHDPTTLNRQGADVGTQYRSAIFANNDEQLRIAQEIKEKVAKEWWTQRPVTTEVTMAGQWYDAENKHQRYLEVHRGGYECPMHRVRKDFPPLSS